MTKHYYDRVGFNTSTLTPQELERSLKLEEHVSILEDHLAGQDGTYGWMGENATTVPKAAFDGMTHTGDRVARVRARMNEGGPPLMISYDTATDTPMFAEEDKEAFDLGYICQRCYQYQGVPGPKCNWRNNPDNHGCGHRNY